MYLSYNKSVGPPYMDPKYKAHRPAWGDTVPSCASDFIFYKVLTDSELKLAMKMCLRALWGPLQDIR